MSRDARGGRRSVGRALHATAEREQVTSSSSTPVHERIRVARRWRTPRQILEARHPRSPSLQPHIPAVTPPSGSWRQDLFDPPESPWRSPSAAGLAISSPVQLFPILQPGDLLRAAPSPPYASDADSGCALYDRRACGADAHYSLWVSRRVPHTLVGDMRMAEGTSTSSSTFAETGRL